jgi:limonene 1,2-monooxygenase
MLQFRRDLDLVEHLDKLGYDEFWCGEHHSSGWEMIGSPEMFLRRGGRAHPSASSSPRGRVPAVSPSVQRGPTHGAARLHDGRPGDLRLGPGALASDAHTLGVDPMLLRDRQDEAIGIIRRLFRGERVTVKSDWFTLQDAALQLLPLQEEMPFAVASQISPSGMTLAGKHGIGIISIGSLSEEGLNALPTPMELRGGRGRQARPDRRSQELARAAELAHRRDPREGPRRGPRRPAAASQRVHHRDAAAARRASLQHPDEAVDKTAFRPGAAATIGTPDDLVERIKSVLAVRGFGTVVGFVHDWANPENTMRSWDMVARYVVPEINGYLGRPANVSGFRAANNREYFKPRARSCQAKITENEAAGWPRLAVTNVRPSVYARLVPVNVARSGPG